MTQCVSGHGLRLHMQDAGRCGASGRLHLSAHRSPHPCLFLKQGVSLSVLPDSCPPETWFFSPVARSCRHSGTTEPFTRTGRDLACLSSSGGGLFDGRPKTQTWVWGAFVLSPGSSLGSHASVRFRGCFTTLNARKGGISGPTKSREAAPESAHGVSRKTRRVSPLKGAKAQSVVTNARRQESVPSDVQIPKRVAFGGSGMIPTSGLGETKYRHPHGYRDFRSNRLFPNGNRPSLPQAFHRLWKRSCSPI